MKETSRSRRSSAEMFPLMERYEQDNQSQADFCRAHDLSMPVFQYWWRRYREVHSLEKEEQPPGFVPIELSSEADYAVEIRYADGTRLRFSQAMSVAYLQQLLSQS